VANKERICPLMSKVIIDNKGKPFLYEVNCKKDKCAWWAEYINPEYSRCVLQDLAYEIKDIHSCLKFKD